MIWIPFSLAVKKRFGGVQWSEWAEDIRLRWQNALDYYREEMYFEIEFQEYMQFKFRQQWMKLKAYAFLSKHPIPYFEGRLLIGSSTPHFLFFAIFFPPSISLVNTENQAVFHARQSYFVRYTYFDIKRWESSMFRIDCLC